MLYVGAWGEPQVYSSAFRVSRASSRAASSVVRAVRALSTAVGTVRSVPQDATEKVNDC